MSVLLILWFIDVVPVCHVFFVSLQSFKSQSMFDKPDILKTSQKSLSNKSYQEFTDFSEVARFNVSMRTIFIIVTDKIDLMCVTIVIYH